MSQLWYRVRYCFRLFSVLCYIHGGSKANMDLTFILGVWWLSLLNEAFLLAFTRPLPSTPGSPKPHLTRPRHEARHVSKMQFWSCHLLFKIHSHPVFWQRCKLVHIFWVSVANIYQEFNKYICLMIQQFYFSILSICPQQIVLSKVFWIQRCLMQHYLR